eukprot:3686231-Rhodomonas_salina.1
MSLWLGQKLLVRNGGKHFETNLLRYGWPCPLATPSLVLALFLPTARGCELAASGLGPGMEAQRQVGERGWEKHREAQTRRRRARRRSCEEEWRKEEGGGRFVDGRPSTGYCHGGVERRRVEGGGWRVKGSPEA